MRSTKGTFDLMANDMRSTFIHRFSLIRKVTIGAFLKRKNTNVSGTYFLFSDSGELLYVGRSKNIRTRVASHLYLAQSTLLWHVCVDLGIGVERKSAHRCNCGSLTYCRSGDVKLKVDIKYLEIQSKMKRSYKVAVLSGLVAHDMESMFAAVLKPKYGWHRVDW